MNKCVNTLTFVAGRNHSSVSCHWGLGVCRRYRQEDWSCAVCHPNGSALLVQSGTLKCKRTAEHVENTRCHQHRRTCVTAAIRHRNEVQVCFYAVNRHYSCIGSPLSHMSAS